MNKMDLETVFNKYYDTNANKELTTAEANIKKVVSDIEKNISDYSISELFDFIYEVSHYMHHIEVVNGLIPPFSDEGDYDTSHEYSFITDYKDNLRKLVAAEYSLDIDDDEYEIDEKIENIVYGKEGLEEFLSKNNLLNVYKTYITAEIKSFNFDFD